eukprot:2428-Heterococcus_DN1.PRE.7
MFVTIASQQAYDNLHDNKHDQYMLSHSSLSDFAVYGMWTRFGINSSAHNSARLLKASAAGSYH